MAELYDRIGVGYRERLPGACGRAVADHDPPAGRLEIVPVPIPHDCSDGFLGAYWRRPESYFDAGVRSAISCFDRIDPTAALQRLRRYLDSGAWEARYGAVRRLDQLDLGYRGPGRRRATIRRRPPTLT